MIRESPRLLLRSILRGVIRLLVIAPPDFAPLGLLSGEADLNATVGTSAEALRSAASQADAVLVAPRYGAVLRELWSELGAVRWLHTLAAGVDFLPFDLLKQRDVVVTNSKGLYADALGEFAIAAMLWFAKDLARLARNQAAARWEPYTVERLEGRAVGIVGYGGIGRAVERRAAAMGDAGDDGWKERW
jgi:phosphoglycerate dehydrogenase-like enzyme